METMQQPKIVGYRQLSEAEALLMNQIKSHGGDLELLVKLVNEYVINQDVTTRAALVGTGSDEMQAELLRLNYAQPSRWVAIARTHFQEGLMALTRAVAQPGSF
jgi:hypothetical protein